MTAIYLSHLDDQSIACQAFLLALVQSKAGIKKGEKGLGLADF
jgi:hypothetical protein